MVPLKLGKDEDTTVSYLLLFYVMGAANAFHIPAEHANERLTDASLQVPAFLILNVQGALLHNRRDQMNFCFRLRDLGYFWQSFYF